MISQIIQNVPQKSAFLNVPFANVDADEETRQCVLGSLLLLLCWFGGLAMMIRFGQRETKLQENFVFTSVFWI